DRDSEHKEASFEPYRGRSRGHFVEYPATLQTPSFSLTGTTVSPASFRFSKELSKTRTRYSASGAPGIPWPYCSIFNSRERTLPRLSRADFADFSHSSFVICLRNCCAASFQLRAYWPESINASHDFAADSAAFIAASSARLPAGWSPKITVAASRQVPAAARAHRILFIGSSFPGGPPPSPRRRPAPPPRALPRVGRRRSPSRIS